MGADLYASEHVMQAREIPQELVDIVDEAAGRKHSRGGVVLETLAKVLTRYDELVQQRIRVAAYGWEESSNGSVVGSGLGSPDREG